MGRPADIRLVIASGAAPLTRSTRPGTRPTRTVAEVEVAVVASRDMSEIADRESGHGAAPAAPIRVLAEVFVPGRPKTKGSLDIVRARPGARTIVTENVKGSKEWRQLVARDLAAWRIRMGHVDPFLGPVAARILFALPVPVGVARSVGSEVAGSPAIATRSGDLDKLVRNILDAGQDAGVYRDDVQVCKIITGKVYASDDPNEEAAGFNGALIQMWGMTEWEIRQARSVRPLAAFSRFSVSPSLALSTSPASL